MSNLLARAARNPGKTMGVVIVINVATYLAIIAAAAVGIRYALTGHM
jgi:hypothetical protein